MSPVIINGVDKQGVDINGVQVKQALNAANSTVNKGVYNATLLETVDADLGTGNIKTGVTIFGKAGTVIPGGTETIEKYADASLGLGATYTPAASGIFSFAGQTNLRIEYFSTLAGAWYVPKNGTTGRSGSMAIGDGTNFRIYASGAAEYCLFRHYYSTGTYERNRDEQLVAGASYTPAVSGFFADGQQAKELQMEHNHTTAGWVRIAENSGGSTGGTGDALALALGDGTNLRVKNTGGASYYHVLMRAKMI